MTIETKLLELIGELNEVIDEISRDDVELNEAGIVAVIKLKQARSLLSEAYNMGDYTE